MATLKSMETVLSADGGPFSDAMSHAVLKQREFNDIVKKANSTYMETRTAAEKYAIKVHELKLQLGFGQISQETFNRAMAKAQDQFSTSPFGKMTKDVDNVSAAFKQNLASASPLIGQLTSVGLAATGVGLAFGAVSKAIDIVSGVFSAITNAVANSMSAIDDLVDVSERLGISSSALQVFGLAAERAGLSAETVQKSISKLSLNLAKAVSEGGPAAEALKSVGLSASALKAMAPEDALKQIADAFVNIQSPADQAIFLTDLFGKSGRDMESVLKDGSAGLEEAERMARLYGIALSDVDNQNIADANQSIEDAMQVFKGLANTLAADLAPALKEAAMLMQAFTEKSGGARGILDGLTKAASFTGYGMIGEQLGKLLGDKLFEDQMAANAKPITEAEKAKAMKGVDVAGINAAAEGLDESGVRETKSEKESQSIIDKLKEQQETFDMTAEEIDVYRLKLKGATGEQIEEAKAIAENIALMKEQKKAREEMNRAAEKAAEESKRREEQIIDKQVKDAAAAMEKRQQETKRVHDQQVNDAKKMAEAARTPQQVFTDTLDEALKLAQQGLLTDEQFEAIGKKAKGDLLKDQDKGDFNPDALEKGTAGAFSAIQKSINSARGDTTQAAVKAGNELAKRREKLLQEIRDKPPIIFETAGLIA